MGMTGSSARPHDVVEARVEGFEHLLRLLRGRGLGGDLTRWSFAAALAPEEAVATSLTWSLRRRRSRRRRAGNTHHGAARLQITRPGRARAREQACRRRPSRPACAPTIVFDGSRPASSAASPRSACPVPVARATRSPGPAGRGTVIAVGEPDGLRRGLQAAGDRRPHSPQKTTGPTHSVPHEGHFTLGTLTRADLPGAMSALRQTEDAETLPKSPRFPFPDAESEYPNPQPPRTGRRASRNSARQIVEQFRRDRRMVAPVPEFPQQMRRDTPAQADLGRQSSLLRASWRGFRMARRVILPVDAPRACAALRRAFSGSSRA